MIVVILGGRLGHQLTSYAAGLALARFNNSEVAINKRHVNYYYLEDLGLYPKIIKGTLKPTLFSPHRKQAKNECQQYNPDFFKIKNNSVIRGCWQHIKYTEQILPELKEKIKVIDNPYTVIHIRRGDYLKGRPDLVVDTEYIEKAKLLAPGPYCVVTDDIEWCKKNVKADKYKSDDPAEDFKFLAGGKNCILSASSFSWWAGRLNDKGGQIIAPRNWAPKNWGWNKEHHICPDNWIRI